MSVTVHGTPGWNLKTQAPPSTARTHDGEPSTSGKWHEPSSSGWTPDHFHLFHDLERDGSLRRG
jgi:hypothetical protein